MPARELVSFFDRFKGRRREQLRRTKIDTDRTVVDFVTHDGWRIFWGVEVEEVRKKGFRRG